MYGCDITVSQIEKIENGKSFPGLELLLVYRKHFGVSFEDLLAGSIFGDHPNTWTYPEFASIPGLRNLVNAAETLQISRRQWIAHIDRAARFATEIMQTSLADHGRPPQGAKIKAARDDDEDSPDDDPPDKKK